MKWVLLVDDNAHDRQLLRYNFYWYGYRTIEAANGLEGLEQARNSKSLDLIVSDAVMPLMDGFLFLQSVKHDPHLKKIPFIFYSSVHTNRHDEQLALQMGAAAFIAKPKRREEFWTEICKILLVPHNPLRKQPLLTLDQEQFVKEYKRVVSHTQETRTDNFDEVASRNGVL